MRFANLLGMRLGVALVAATTALIAVPATAQFMSASYKFMEAIKKKDGEEVEKTLAANPTIINTRDYSSGDTPLHLVTQRRDQTWLEYLLAKGGNPNARNDKGTAPLAIAVSLGWAEGAETLLGRGARPNDADSSGETPLIAAVHQRSVDLVRLLLKNGADPLRADNSGRNARDYAELMGKDSLVWTEIDGAAKSAAARRSRSYGPSF